MTETYAPEPGPDAEGVEIDFPEATDCDVDDSQTSREEGEGA